MCRRRPWKAALLLAAMCAVFAMYAAAASPEHRHAEVIGNNCDLCCIGHLPALQSPYSSDIRPSIVANWLASAEEYHPSLDPQLPATLGRAPPV